MITDSRMRDAPIKCEFLMKTKHRSRPMHIWTNRHPDKQASGTVRTRADTCGVWEECADWRTAGMCAATRWRLAFVRGAGAPALPHHRPQSQNREQPGRRFRSYQNRSLAGDREGNRRPCGIEKQAV